MNTLGFVDAGWRDLRFGARLLARNPGWTPDQVKGALMLSAKPAPNVANGSIGVGELNAGKAASLKTAPNPNKAAEQFVKVDASGTVTFDYTSWSTLAHANASWNDA